MNRDRHILHVDMDAFYASVEQRDNPQLRKLPLVVGGEQRGVVAAASYEARKFGIRSAMPMTEARRRCPTLQRVAPRMGHYRDVSAEVFSVFREFTPQVEGLSLDEAFLDVTDSLALFGSAKEIATQIKTRIDDTTHLTASVGVAPNKLVAKIASDLDKPDGLVVVTCDNLRQVLDPLPVSVIPGIGKRTLALLRQAGIESLSDLRCAPDRELEPIFGRMAGRARDRAGGLDERPVVTSRLEKSISAEETFGTDLHHRDDLLRQLLRLTERTAQRLRARKLNAGTLQLKVRRSDFSTYTRQRSLNPPGNGTDQLYEVACRLLESWLREYPGARIRLLGIGGSDLAAGGQQDLFADRESSDGSPLDEAADRIRNRFGNLSVTRARTLDHQ